MLKSVQRQFAGGTAHPITDQHYVDDTLGGITKRDYFAAAALTGLLANDPEAADAAADMARWSYQYADAMLEAREIPAPTIPKSFEGGEELIR